MIVISNLSPSYITEVSAADTTAVVGGAFDINSYNFKLSDVDITQLNIASAFSANAVGSVNTYQ
jgi:hypothetical protein